MQSDNKNVCDVKNNVLNELLCNFSNIKLKIVSPENKKPAMKMDDNKNIAHSIAIDNGIFKEKKRASKSLEKSENEVYDISTNAKLTGINNDTIIVEKIAKKDSTEINIEEKLQNLQNNACNSTIDEKIIEKNVKVTRSNESCDIKNKIAKDHSVEKTIDENISNIRSEEICIKTKIEETSSKSIKSADEVKRESKKLRDIRAPKTILKKKNVEHEQQEMNTYQKKRIPIGAPATMNKIFDSRESEAIAVASRNLKENEKKHEVNSKQNRHSHGKEKTDEVIAITDDEAVDDRGRVANRSTLTLLDDTIGSDDKCAIARKITFIIPCNNNDNNDRATTPVVNISNDQSSRDVVTITPGKVRSFVKYYEIRGDATTVERHSKIKDREKVTKRKSTKSETPPVAARNSQPEVITEGKEIKKDEDDKSVKSNNILKTSSNNIQFSMFAIPKIPKDSDPDDHSICKPEKTGELNVTKEYEKSDDAHLIDEETTRVIPPFVKTGAKKSVQFQGGFTVIHPKTFDKNESAEIVTDYDANASRKRRAPGIPLSRDSDDCQELIREIEKSEKLPDAEKSSFQRREAVAQIHAVTSHGENSDYSSERERMNERERTGTMKNAHPIVRATTSSPVGQDSTGLGSESAEPIIRLKLQKPLHWEWELTTSADALPVIQLLDKDGRLLVETTGRTAQRARGSFKKGLKIHEQFPVDESCPNSTTMSKERTSSFSSPMSMSSTTSSSFVTTTTPPPPPPLQINRNIDGFSSKFGTCSFVPRKSRSDIDIKERRSKKKQSSTLDDPTKMKTKIERNNVEGTTERNKKYSTGDYLRQQIMDDLRTRNTIGKTPEEIAKDRCKKVKAYLRSQSETLLSLVREEEYDGDETKDNKIVSNDKSLGNRILNKNDTFNSEQKDPNRENKKIKSYLRTRSAVIPMKDSTKNDFEANEANGTVREMKDDMNEEELTKIRTFLREKIQRRMNMEQARSRSTVAVDAGILDTVENVRIRKRYSDYDYENDRKNYRTRKMRSETNILRFDSKMLEREKLKFDKQMEKEKSTNFKESSEDFQLRKQSRNYQRSRSEVLVEALELDNRPKSLIKKKSSSLERKKFYCKTKSDQILPEQEEEETEAMVSSENLANFPRRQIKSQENIERSWREYKERRRSEKYRRESIEKELPEEDFMSKPRWKDLQRDLCSSRNCKICQNLRNCVNPLHEKSHEESEGLSMGKKTAKFFEDFEASTNNNSRPGTSLQENYLFLEKKNTNDYRSPIRTEIKVQNRVNDSVGSVSALNVSSQKFAYNTNLSKSAFKNYQELYTRSNVKKSDTFKIVDGSEELKERVNGYDAKTNYGNASDSDFGYLNGEGSLANKSNEDITKDYFKRVYELLKKRQEEMRQSANEAREFPGHEDSSSSNYVVEMQRKRHRRKKKDKNTQGEEIATIPSITNDQEGWKVQRISVNGDTSQSSNRRRGYNRSQLQPILSCDKKNRPAPSPPISYRVNAKDQSDKYFDWPNKENTSGNAVNRCENDQRQVNQVQETEESTMGSNLSRHNGKGLTGRRTQSSGNLCDPKGKLNSMGKILVPCSSSQRERYKFCGSLPNHLDDKDVLDDDQRDNNNIMSDTIGGNFGGTLPHKKRSLGVHFSDSGPTGTLDLVKHRSQDSFDENDPWRYQQSDLDLVRCRHGNFDSVKRNRSADTVLVDSGRKYGRSVALEDRCHRNSDLDLVGTLPKRKQDARTSSGRSLESNSSSSQPCIVNATDDDDLLMKMMHKPDCELLKHRQQFGKCVDLKLSKLTSSEPQDQGYASERSPEDEHPPSLPGQPFPSVTPESTFRVTLQKSSRGLGLSVSGGGTAGPVRVKRLFPQQPAALSNKLQTGDILLAANGIPLTGLTNYEALEVLRTTPSTVELVVCRLPGDSNVTPPGAPPPPPARREPSSLRILNPLPPLQIEPCGEFDIEMTKVGGSLGFTLRKADSSALGHYVRALVREPALSDGRIRPGDKIVAVDNAPLSPMSHEEAVQLLRQCGPTVKLRLYRDLAQTPVSALSPTEPDHPLRPPRTSLRQEAVDMLCDLAVRKLSPGTSSGSSSCKQQSPGVSCNSPRRLRRLATRTSTAETNQETPEGKLHDVQTTSSTASQAETASDSDQCSVKTQITNSQANTPATDIIDPPPLYDIYDDDDDDESSKQMSNNAAAARPSFLDLSAPQGKPHFQFCSIDSDGEYPADGEVILAEAERGRLAEPNYDNDRSVTMMSSDEHDNDLPSEPASMPPMLSSTSSTSTAAFSYKNPAYQSANPACSTVSDPAGPKNKTTHSSDQDIPGKILGTDDPGGSKGLLKWKGVMFAPNDEVDTEHDPEETGKDTTDSVTLADDLEQGSEVFMVELTRGWNSRLGFSLQPEGNCTVISVVHPDSVAAKDGRLKQGDVLLMVNEESVEHMSTADIIDLLRKIRGSIGITVMRRLKRDNIT